MKISIKHSASLCRAARFIYWINRKEKIVEAVISHIDSSLITAFADLCEREEGIEVVRDEGRSGHKPDYTIILILLDSKKKFKGEVVRLADQSSNVVLKEMP